MFVYLKKNNQIDIQKIEFNRFLKFRYGSAIFLFFNFYWFILFLSTVKIGILLPAVMLIAFILEIVEQTKKYWHPTNDLKITKIVFFMQAMINLFAIILVLFGKLNSIFPFFSNTISNYLIVFLLIGCLFSIYLFLSAQKIESNTDNYFKQIQVLKNNTK